MTHELDRILGDRWPAAEFLVSQRWVSARELVASIEAGISRLGQASVVVVTAREPCVAAVASLRLQGHGMDVVCAGHARRLPAIQDFFASRQAEVMPAISVALSSAPEADLRLHAVQDTATRLPSSAGRLVFSTSGSTGLPKLVGFNREQVRFITFAVGDAVGYESGDVVVSALPASFDYGFYQIALCMRVGCRFAAAGSVALPREALEVASKYSSTVLPLTPAFGRAIVAAAQGEHFPNIRLITSTGAALSNGLQERLQGTFPNADILPMYGLTECKRVSVSTPSLALSRPDSVGIPLPGTTVRIISAAGSEQPHGTPGEAVVYGPHVAHGYYAASSGDGELQQDPDGTWRLHTGDLMASAPDGALFHFGRMRTDFVKLLDERISLHAIEEAIRGLEGVNEAQVVAVLDEDGLVGRLDAAVVTMGVIGIDVVKRRVRRDVGAAAARHLDIRYVEGICLSENGKVRLP